MIIDSNVRHGWTSDSELRPFLSSEAYELFAASGGSSQLAQWPGFGIPSSRRSSADYAAVAHDLLERLDGYRAILTYDRFNLAALRDGELAAEVARAMNDWTVAEWLDRDSRVLGSIIVATQRPDLAAVEIARLAQVPRMGQVILGGNGIGRALGHSVFHPIYRAAAEVGLPVAIHAGSAGGANPPSVAGGGIARYMEQHALAAQAAATQIASLIANGVFELLPGLRVVVLGAGVAWLPALVWRMDTDFKGVRREVPWLRQAPSYYVWRHMFFDVHPLESSEPDPHLTAVLHSLESSLGLLFGSGYPAWDTEDVATVERVMPAEWHDQILSGNARTLYPSEKVDIGDALTA